MDTCAWDGCVGTCLTLLCLCLLTNVVFPYHVAEGYAYTDHMYSFLACGVEKIMVDILTEWSYPHVQLGRYPKDNMQLFTALCNYIYTVHDLTVISCLSFPSHSSSVSRDVGKSRRHLWPSCLLLYPPLPPSPCNFTQ